MVFVDKIVIKKVILRLLSNTIKYPFRYTVIIRIVANGDAFIEGSGIVRFGKNAIIDFAHGWI